MQPAAPDPPPPLGQALRLIVEGTASARSGDDFFRALVRSLASALGFRFGMVGALPPGVSDRVQTLAVWDGNSFIANFEYPLKGTPCSNVVGRTLCYFPSDVQAQFPHDPTLKRLGVQSYGGAPLFASDGAPLGLLSVMHDQATQSRPECEPILRIFATRAAAELERQRAEDALRQARDELERRVNERTAQLAAANERLQASEEHFKTLADSNRRLLMELDHRVRNNLTGLLSVLSLMRGKASDVPSFANAIESRIMAMVQVHRLMSEAAWGPVEIRVLAQSLLAATKLMACHEIPVETVGPEVRLPPERAQALAMIILEWFTNSCKHGAHTRPTGRLRIEWELDKPRQRVRLHWRETGGPPIPQPVTASLGTDLVRAFASRELGGTVELRFPEPGVDHLLEFSADGEG